MTIIHDTESTCAVIRVDGAQELEWDKFVSTSNDGTLFHRQEFLRYHGTRFAGREHFLEIQRKRRRIGVWPMALIDRGGRMCALSPYGSSYGGPALAEPLSLFACRDVLGAVISYVKQQGALEFRLTLPPPACSRVYSDTFRFALMEAGFCCTNRDITSVIPIDPALPEHPQFVAHLSEWERRARKARKLGIKIRQNAPLDDFWHTLEVTFRKHGLKPTHTRDELGWLEREMSGQVYASCAYLGDAPVAGVCYFVQNSRVLGTFYLCQDPEYQNTQAQSALLLDGLVCAREQGFAWIDLGTSSVGMKAYDPVFRFKETLGSLGQFRETYVLNIPT